MIMLAAVSTALLFTGIAAMVAGAGVSIWSGFQANSAAKDAAAMQNDAAMAAANTQRMAAEAQAQQLRDQAELAGLQASLEDKRAGVEQQQAQIEAQRRMVQLSETIGATYAQYAGNNLLVDGGNDTLGQLLTANTREAAQDIGIIKSNDQNAVWEHSMNKTMALLSQKSYEGQAANALTIGEANAQSTLLSGMAQSYATRQQGKSALYSGWGSGISMIGSAAVLGYNAFGPAAAAGSGAVNTNNVYAWNTTGGIGLPVA